MNRLFKAALKDYLNEADEMLLEDRLDFIWERYKAKFKNREVFDIIVSHDPTQKKIYAEWLAKLFTNGSLKVEDLYKAHEDLEIFDRVKARMPGNQRDINAFKTPAALYDAIQPYADTKSGKEQKRDDDAEFKKDITIVYSGPEGSVKTPKTQAASCFLGRGTRWCTAATSANNMFDSYARRGDLFIFTFPNGVKWQAHLANHDLMDEQDHEVPWEKLTNTALWHKVEKQLIDYYLHLYPDRIADLATKILNRRVPEAEHKLLSNVTGSRVSLDQLVSYAQRAVKGRWHEAEPFLLRRFDDNQHAIRMYIQNCVKGRWKEAEAEFVSTRWEMYENREALRQFMHVSNIVTRWPELEKRFEDTNNLEMAYFYFMDLVKTPNPGRWHGIETVLMAEYKAGKERSGYGDSAGDRCTKYSQRVNGWPEYDHIRRAKLGSIVELVKKNFKIAVEIDRPDPFQRYNKSILFPGRRITLNWDRDYMQEFVGIMQGLDTVAYTDVWEFVGFDFLAKHVEKIFRDNRITAEDYIEVRILREIVNSVEGWNTLKIEPIGKHFGQVYQRLQVLTSGRVSHEQVQQVTREFTDYANLLNK